MKISKKMALALLVMPAIALTSCNNTDNVLDSSIASEKEDTSRYLLTLSVSYPQDSIREQSVPNKTRVTYTDNANKGFDSSWEASDKLSLYATSTTTTPDELSIIRMTGDKAVFQGTTSARYTAYVMYPAKSYEPSTSSGSIMLDLSEQTGRKADLKNYDYMTGRLALNSTTGIQSSSITLEKLTNTFHIKAQLNPIEANEKINAVYISGSDFYNKVAFSFSSQLLDRSSSKGSTIGYIKVSNDDMVCDANGNSPDIYVKVFTYIINSSNSVTITFEMANGRTYTRTLGRNGKELSINSITYGYGKLVHLASPMKTIQNLNTYVFSDGAISTLPDYYSDKSKTGWPIAWVVNAADNVAGNVIAQNGDVCNGIAIAMTDAEINAVSKFKWSSTADKYDNSPLETNATDPVYDYNGHTYTYSTALLSGSTPKASQQANYPVFYAAGQYGTQASKLGGSRTMAAPQNCTEWFVPSMGQWHAFFVCNLGEFTSTRTAAGITTYSDATFFVKMQTAMEYQLTRGNMNIVNQAIGSNVNPDITTSYAVSSDGYTAHTIPYYINFGEYGRETRLQYAQDGTSVSGSTISHRKTDEVYRVRPFIAFKWTP